jgi:molybdopterin converting factor subunit 1
MIEVLFFGAAADRAGTRQTGLEVRDGATLAEVWPLIVERYPDLGPMGGTLAFAVNGEYARANDTVSTGDEVAVLPPVSGG